MGCRSVGKCEGVLGHTTNPQGVVTIEGVLIKVTSRSNSGRKSTHSASETALRNTGIDDHCSALLKRSYHVLNAICRCKRLRHAGTLLAVCPTPDRCITRWNLDGAVGKVCHQLSTFGSADAAPHVTRNWHYGIVSASCLGCDTPCKAHAQPPSDPPRSHPTADRTRRRFFRWAARLNFHEGVATTFSVAVNEDGTQQFLMNPQSTYFAHQASRTDSGQWDANDSETMNRLTRLIPPLGAYFVRYIGTARTPESLFTSIQIHATVLSTLQDPRFPPVDQNRAMFFDRFAIDKEYGGLAFEEEQSAKRCSTIRSHQASTDHVPPRRHGDR